MPALAWLPAQEFCSKCTKLATPWATSPEQRRNAVGGGLDGYGTPDAVLVSIADASPGPNTGIVYDVSSSRPLAAWRIDFNDACGRVAGPAFTQDGAVGLQVTWALGAPQASYIRDRKDVPSLMDLSRPDVRWPASVTGTGAVNEAWFSMRVAVVDFERGVGIGTVETGTASSARELAGSPKEGSFVRGEAYGDTAFLGRMRNNGWDWWVHKDGALRPFIAKEGYAITSVVTDGKVLVWHEVPTGRVSPLDASNLYYSSYSTNPDELKPVALSHDLPVFFDGIVLRNDVVAGYYNKNPNGRRKDVAVVVKLRDGVVHRVELPGDYSWGTRLYPGRDELWGSVNTGQVGYETIVRMPYSAMN